MQTAVLRSWTTTHKSTRCKEAGVRAEGTIQPSKTVEGRNTSAWAAKRYRVLVQSSSPVTFTTAKSLLGCVKTRWKKRSLSPCSRQERLEWNRNSTALRDQNLLQDWTEQGTKIMCSGEEGSRQLTACEGQGDQAKRPCRPFPKITKTQK